MRISATAAKPVGAKQKTRGNGRPPFAGESEIYRVPPAQSLWWSVSRFLAEAAALVVIATLILLALSRPLNLRDRLAGILPGSVVEYFSSDSATPDTAALDAIRSKVADDAKAIRPTPQASADRTTTFTLGSSKQQVRAAQGAPTTESDTVWRYGASEVYFAGGRVVGWNAAPANPLRTR